MERARNESLTIVVPNNGPRAEGPPWSMRMRYHKEMAIIEGARNEGSIGPDLAWLPLTRDQAQMLQDGGRSRAVFYNLTTGLRTFDAFKRRLNTHGRPGTNEIIRDNLFIAVGWNREIHARSERQERWNLDDRSGVRDYLGSRWMGVRRLSNQRRQMGETNLR